MLSIPYYQYNLSASFPTTALGRLSNSYDSSRTQHLVRRYMAYSGIRSVVSSYRCRRLFMHKHRPKQAAQVFGNETAKVFSSWHVDNSFRQPCMGRARRCTHICRIRLNHIREMAGCIGSESGEMTGIEDSGDWRLFSLVRSCSQKVMRIPLWHGYVSKPPSECRAMQLSSAQNVSVKRPPMPHRDFLWLACKVNRPIAYADSRLPSFTSFCMIVSVT
jgi:hypothetical protein